MTYSEYPMQRLKLGLIVLLVATLQACGGGNAGESVAASATLAPTKTEVISIDGGTDKKRILVVDQAPPSLTHVDIGQKGGSHGDVLAYDAKITTTAGMSGKLSGMITTVAVPEPGEVAQDRIGELVFDFPDAGTLVVGGKSVYPFDKSGTEEMQLNIPQMRPVVGGTGEFLGAVGQVRTTRNANLSYTHEFELVGITTWTKPTSTATAAAQRSITLNHARPNLVHVDIGQEGETHGDLLAVDAEFSSIEGLTGELSGIMTTIDISESDDGGLQESVFHDRFFKGVFDFGGANTLVVFGKSVYPAGASDMNELGVGVPSIISVVGGTGDFMNARGQVVTTRKEDGTYTQVLQLVGIKPTPAQQSRLTLRQTPPYLVHVDVGLGEGSHGDILAFDAEVASAKRLIGKLSGMVTTIDIPEPGGLVFKDRIVHMVLDLDDANTLVMAGKSVYPFDGSPDSEFEKNIPQTRAIIGGTGEYIGAKGQVATTRNDDGSYTHELRFAGPR